MISLDEPNWGNENYLSTPLFYSCRWNKQYHICPHLFDLCFCVGGMRTIYDPLYSTRANEINMTSFVWLVPIRSNVFLCVGDWEPMRSCHCSKVLLIIFDVPLITCENTKLLVQISFYVCTNRITRLYGSWID